MLHSDAHSKSGNQQYYGTGSFLAYLHNVLSIFLLLAVDCVHTSMPSSHCNYSIQSNLLREIGV